MPIDAGDDENHPVPSEVGNKPFLGDVMSEVSAAPVQRKTDDGNAPSAKAKVAPVKKARSFGEYVVKPATPQVYDPLAGKKTLGGTDLAAVNTKAAEAKVLNALRQEDKRFNPAALIVAQKNLQVANATGAFNTETLRQLRAKTSDTRLAAADPKVVVAAIVDESLWKPFHTSPGVDLFFAPVDGAGGKSPDRTATRRADRVAQAMGYESYKTYKAQFQPFTFLGVKPEKGKDQAHPHLIARLQAAEAFLKQRHGAGVTPETIGWKGGLVGIYHTDPEKIEKGAAHFHTMGLAVDFDASINAYLYPQRDLELQTVALLEDKNTEIGKRNKAKKPDEALEELFDAHGIATEWVKEQTNVMEVAFTQAGYLFHAVVLTKAKMMDWSATLSTEELHARIASAAAALKQYYDLAKSGTDKQIIDKFVAAGFTDAQAREALPEMRKFPDRYSGGFSRGPTKGLPTTHSLDLMVALRDVAGLNYGGSEMSHGDNGDFMHFDCRNDALGQRALGVMFE
ncbi:MAG TPA: hypothetical protein VN253_11250 [Kofleriaceae bacterium]|nr:hypothetical protein [Kofleriaceae bacterium]